MDKNLALFIADSENFMAALGRAMAAMMKARGITQKDLAAALGVAERTVRRWWRGESAPSIVELRLACMMCDVDYLRFCVQVENDMYRLEE